MSEETKNLESKIHKQISFYLSDSNLPFDKFLWDLHSKNDGWIPIATVANFKKMQWYTTDLETVIKALEAPSDLFELDADKKHIRRIPEVKQRFDVLARSIYAKGFPLVDKDEPNSVQLFELQDKIDDFFAEHAKVLCVRLRKTDDKPSTFKGSVYAELASEEDAKKLAAMDLSFEGNKLEVMLKKDYLEMKEKLYQDNPDKGKAQRRKKNFNAFKANNFKTNNFRNTRSNQGHAKKEVAKAAEADTQAGEKRKAEEEMESNRNQPAATADANE